MGFNCHHLQMVDKKIEISIGFSHKPRINVAKAEVFCLL
jgi:hypothetical protein